MRIKKKVCRFYVDGIRMAGDVLAMALTEQKHIGDMKKDLAARYHGHTVTFKVERE